METIIVPSPLTFENLWSLLYGNGTTNYSKYDCNTLWESLTTDQRHELYSNLKQRLQQKKYVPYNGLQAMRETLRRIELEHRAAVRKQTLSYSEYYSIMTRITWKEKNARLSGTLCGMTYRFQYGKQFMHELKRPDEYQQEVVRV